MEYLHQIIGEFEQHSVEGIRFCFENGVNPNTEFQGRPLVYALINMYLRSPKFKNCISLFVEYGLQFEDKALLAVLLDDAVLLDKSIRNDPNLLNRKYSLNCAFTPIYKASLLHICAEYNHLDCAKMLVQSGIDLNVKAGTDAYGFGGQTPIFHTVNQFNNNSIGVLQFLLEEKADLLLTLRGIIWGKGYEWETFIPAVNPISYAMMGLLRQFQRTEEQIYEIVFLLLKANDGIDYYPGNVPNKYLNPKTHR